MRELYEAAAAVFVYKNEIYVIKRQNYLNAFPGYHAFPGGKIDVTDRERVFKSNLLNSFNSKVISALCREIREELNFDIEQAIDGNMISDVSKLSVTTAPYYIPIRFKIYYFKIVLTTRPFFFPSESEIKSAMWMLPSQVLNDFKTGKSLMVPATINIVRELMREMTIEEIPRVGFQYDYERKVPLIEFIKGIRQALPLSNTLPPSTRTGVCIIGDEGENKLLIDPAPRDRNEMKKLLSTISSFGITHIFLTHHHPDHVEYSNEISQILNIPILLHETTKTKIEEKYYSNFFSGVECLFIKEGDVVTKWFGENVLSYEIPGHAVMQLGLMPASKRWFLVGDMIQGIGTVVVHDMEQYMNSLKRIISLDPEYIIPSHGIILGGVDILKKALKHRRTREKRISDLHKRGKSIDEILKTLYSDIPESLYPYARQNILAHMKKLGI